MRGHVIRFISLLSAALLIASSLCGCGLFDPSGPSASGGSAKAAIFIAEAVSQNDTLLADEDGDYSDYIALYNGSSGRLSLSGYYLTDKEDKPQKWALPDVSLGAGEYLVVFASGKDRRAAEPYHTNFSLAASGESVYLTAPNGTTASFVTLPAMNADMAYGYVMSGSDQGQYHVFLSGMPGKENTNPHAKTVEQLLAQEVPTVVINEYMTDNECYYADSFGEYRAWAELHNTTEKEVSLDGICLSDDADKPDKWAFPKGTVIAAGGYATVYFSGRGERTEGGELHAGFKISGKETVLLLSTPAGVRLSEVAIRQQAGGVSCGLSGGAWRYFSEPTPGAVNAAQSYDELMDAARLDRRGLWISEVSSVPMGTNTDNYDWVELYNGSGSDINLAGYGIGRDPAKKEYTFESVTIKAGQYMLLYAAGETPAKPTRGAVYLPFKISNSGEELFLTAADGHVIDVFNSGKLRGGVTSGRVGTQSSARVFFATPTPKAENNRGYALSYAPMPSLSREGGYAESGTVITGSAPAGVTLRYTTDGAVPTESSKVLGELKITKTTVLKVCAFAEGMLPSDPVSETYIVENRHDIPVVSLSADPADLFSDSKGILANGPGYAEPFPYKGANFWKDWERQATIEYFSPDGAKNLEFGVGVKVFGQYTRAYDQKSLALHLRDQYGAGELHYPFFANNDITEIHDLVLRAGGQDQKFTRIRDALCSQIMKGHTTLAFMDWQPVAVYINGEYYGLYGLREKINEDYFATHEGLDKDNIDMVRGNSILVSGTNAQYKDLIAYVKSHDLSVQSNYDHVCAQVDIDNYIDYLITEIFFANGDTGNIKFYREHKEGSKWKWVMFDFDMALRVEALWSSETYNMLKKMFNPNGHGSGNAFSTALQCALIKNKDFKQRFIARYAELLNTVFMPDNMLSVLEGMTNQIATEMVLHGARWKRPEYNTWLTEVKDLQRILKGRRDFAKKQLIAYFSLSDAQVSALFPNG